jgi:2-polyprenyl-3-methyl-5-hydroxy-6-metoxy-1,4-benzoquinol methylase
MTILDSQPETLTSPANRRPSPSCPCCGSNVTQTFYRVRSIPVHSCVLLDSVEKARAFPRRDLELAYCSSCGFIFNHMFDEAVMAYSPNFEESQHFSNTFNAFARKLASQIASKCNVAGKHVLEIGCGKGEFLRELCRVGGATGLGIDPGYREDNGRGEGGDEVQFVVDAFSPKYQQLQADVVLCRHTLEHIAPVAEFVRSIRAMIGAHDGARVVFETPDAKRVLEEGAFWDIYYEHCSYFSPGTHARLFRQERFDVTELALVYDGQYIVQYARPAPSRTQEHLLLERDLAEVQALAKSFPDRVERVLSYWRTRVRTAWNGGRRIVIWGGGSKGVAFLTTLGFNKEIAAAVDVNPYKQGKFVPGTGHPVIAPTALVNDPPDLVIVMNPIYIDEITAILRTLRLEPEIVGVGSSQ